MIVTRRDKGNKVISYLEYFQLNKEAQFDNDGKYIYVNEFWIHSKYKDKIKINDYIQEIIPKYDSVDYVYWNRRKYDDRMSFYKVVRYKGKVKLIRQEF